LEWEKKERNDDFLLRGSDLHDAEAWLNHAISENLQPSPTNQQIAYTRKSREVDDANKRLTEAGEKAHRLIRLGVGVLAGTLCLAATAGIIAARKLQIANRSVKLANIEEASLNALQTFESRDLEIPELQSLVMAMKAGQELKALVNNDTAFKLP
jgi:hypothetical protein